MTRDEIKVIIGTYSLEQLSLSIEEPTFDKKILTSLGAIADLKIDKLIENQILTEVNGKLLRPAPKIRIKLLTTKKHLPKLFSFFKEKNMHKKTNMMYAYQECVPQETIKKIIDLQYETFMKCYRLMEQDKSANGEIYLLSTYVENFNFE